MGLRTLVLALALAAGLLLPVAPASAEVVSTAPPTVRGEAVHAGVLRADHGSWTPPPTAYAYQWLRDGEAVPGATRHRYRLRLDDLGARMSVAVTATDSSGGTASATSAPTAPVRRARLQSRRPPQVVGELRFGRTVEARPGRWSRSPERVRYQWLRAGRPIAGATSPRYRLVAADVGHRLRVEVQVRRPGHLPARAVSEPREPVGHRVDVRRTVTYHVETRGRITAGLARFRRLVQQTYDDPRGWRGAGVRFRPVAKGGRFTVVLAEAARVPDFSPVCSSSWSCRVGRYVIINQDRWQHASPAWNAAGGALRDYRHMVVDHETGHWLGLGHAGCPGRGRPAPVMMQQSKGLDGCRFNPFPTLGELGRV